jgi:ribosomal protein S18 acetylase RimI-like enzyme
MRIRPACSNDTAAMARVRVDTWKVSFRNIVPDWYLDLLSYEVTEREWHCNLWEENKGRQAFVLENEPGEVVGIAIYGPARDEEDSELLKDFRGEIYVLYVLPAFQCQKAIRDWCTPVPRHSQSVGLRPSSFGHLKVTRQSCITRGWVASR